MESEIRNMLEKYSLQRFRDSYRRYYKKEVEIDSYERDYVYIKGKIVRVSVRTLSSVAAYYNWRMGKNISCDDPITSTDIDFLEDLYKRGTITIAAVAFVFGVSDSAMRNNYRDTKNIKDAYDILVNGKAKRAELFLYIGELEKYKNVSLSAEDWGKELCITTTTFRNRIYRHGHCYLIFLLKDDYLQVPTEIKNQYVSTRVKKKYGSVEAVKKTDTRQITEHEYKEFLKQVTYDASVNIITELIADSKDNLLAGPKKDNTYYEDSRRFLMNANGLLEYYLECINVPDVKACVDKLRDFATIGYTQELTKSRKSDRR